MGLTSATGGPVLDCVKFSTFTVYMSMVFTQCKLCRFSVIEEKNYLANKICFCILNGRIKFDPLVDAFGMHLEGPQGDARLGAHLIRATVNLYGLVSPKVMVTILKSLTILKVWNIFLDY